jgi:hypothetical protein
VYNGDITVKVSALNMFSLKYQLNLTWSSQLWLISLNFWKKMKALQAIFVASEFAAVTIF